jgi:ferritin
VGEVDNQSSTTEVRNFMLGPVFGKNGKPNGIIQFINKLDEFGCISEITAADISKFNDMKELFGMCIENTAQISKTIGITL